MDSWRPLPQPSGLLHPQPWCPVCGSERLPRVLDEGLDACRLACEDCHSHWLVPPDRLPPPGAAPER